MVNSLMRYYPVKTIDRATETTAEDGSRWCRNILEQSCGFYAEPVEVEKQTILQLYKIIGDLDIFIGYLFWKKNRKIYEGIADE